MADDVPTRGDAIQMAREDRRRTLALLDGVAPEAWTLTGLGGGEWSPKDLIGHLESWEEHALGALDAWERGEEPRIGGQLRSIGTDELNRMEFERKANRSLEETRSSAAATHARLLERFEALSDTRWAEAPLPNDEYTVGGRLGSILGGQLGGFRHDPDHWTDLEAFVAAHPAPRSPG
jgi:DinB superfamily